MYMYIYIYKTHTHISCKFSRQQSCLLIVLTKCMSVCSPRQQDLQDKTRCTTAQHAVLHQTATQ